MCTKVFKRAKKVLWPPGANFMPIQTENGIIPWWITWSVDTCWFFFLRMKNSWKRTTTSVIPLTCKRARDEQICRRIFWKRNKNEKREKIDGNSVGRNLYAPRSLKLPHGVNYQTIFLIANLYLSGNSLLKRRQMLLGFALPTFVGKKKKREKYKLAVSRTPISQTIQNQNLRIGSSCTLVLRLTRCKHGDHPYCSTILLSRQSYSIS